MATLTFPLGFEIKGNSPTADSGQAIDARSVFTSYSARTAYTSNFFYEGLLNYTIGSPYHGSGVSNNSGFYFRYNDTGSYSWKGLDADTLDGKHANGTFDWVVGSENNLVEYVNALKTITDGLTVGLIWKASVSTYTSLPSVGNTTNDVRVVQDTRNVYKWDSSAWVMIDSAFIPVVSATVDGLLPATWYTNVLAFNTTPSNYQNVNNFGDIKVYNALSLTGDIIATSFNSTLKINGGSGITLTSNGSDTITISSNGSGVTMLTNDQIPIAEYSSLVGSNNFKFNPSTKRLTLYDDNSNIIITENTTGVIDGSSSDSIILATNTALKSFGIITNSLLLGSNVANNIIDITNSVLIGSGAGLSTGYGISVNNRFLLSTTNSSQECNLLDGTFPSSSVAYGSLKVRGDLQIKESDVSLGRNTTGGTNMTFTDPRNGTVTLYDLLHQASAYTFGDGLTNTAGTITLGGPVTVANRTITLNSNKYFSIIDGSALSLFKVDYTGTYLYINDEINSISTTIKNNNTFSDTTKGILLTALNTNNSNTTSLNISTDYISFTGTTKYPTGKTITTDYELTYKKYVDDLITQTLLGDYHYYRTTFNTNTEGDIRVKYTTIARLTDRYESGNWVSKEILNW